MNYLPLISIFLQVMTFRFFFAVQPLRCSGGMNVPGYCKCRGVLLIWIIVEQWPTLPLEGASVELFGYFFFGVSFLFLSLSMRDSPI